MWYGWSWPHALAIASKFDRQRQNAMAIHAPHSSRPQLVGSSSDLTGLELQIDMHARTHARTQTQRGESKSAEIIWNHPLDRSLSRVLHSYQKLEATVNRSTGPVKPVARRYMYWSSIRWWRKSRKRRMVGELPRAQLHKRHHVTCPAHGANIARISSRFPSQPGAVSRASFAPRNAEAELVPGEVARKTHTHTHGLPGYNSDHTRRLYGRVTTDEAARTRGR